MMPSSFFHGRAATPGRSSLFFQGEKLARASSIKEPFGNFRVFFRPSFYLNATSSAGFKERFAGYFQAGSVRT